MAANRRAARGGNSRHPNMPPVLSEEDKAARVRFANTMLGMMRDGVFDPQNCVWTKMDVMGNGEASVMLWMGMHGKAGMLGPFFPEEIPSEPNEPEGVVTPRKYKILLETKVMPQLRSKLSEADLSKCWFQTADVLPDNCLEFLHPIFGNRIMAGASDPAQAQLSPFSSMPTLG